MIRFQCPVCHATMSAPDPRAGLKGACPSCGQRLQIPTGPPSVRGMRRSPGQPVGPEPPATVRAVASQPRTEEPHATPSRRLPYFALGALCGLLIGLGVGVVATLAIVGARGTSAEQAKSSRPQAEQLGVKAGPAGEGRGQSRTVGMTREEFRKKVMSFKAINEGRQWDGINQDDGLTGLFFFAKDFYDAFGKPIKTETIGDRAYWYWRCTDGVVQVVLHDKLGKMMRSYKDGTIKAFEEPGATKLNPGDVAALIAINEVGLAGWAGGGKGSEVRDKERGPVAPPSRDDPAREKPVLPDPPPAPKPRTDKGTP